MLKGLQHIALVVDDVDASRAFYRDALGMNEVPRPSSFTFGGAWLRAGTDEVHLILRSDTTQLDPPQRGGVGLQSGLVTHLAFEVDDLEADAARVKDYGSAPVAGPLNRGDGVRQMYFSDPDGYIVELFELTGEDQSSTVRRPAGSDGALGSMPA